MADGRDGVGDAVQVEDHFRATRAGREVRRCVATHTRRWEFDGGGSMEGADASRPARGIALDKALHITKG